MVAAVELLDRVLQHDVDALLAEVDVVAVPARFSTARPCCLVLSAVK